MDVKALKQRLSQALREQSGLEKRRPYLGMSSIAQCSRKLYFDFVEGRGEQTDRDHWYCWLGYLYEGAVLGLLRPSPLPLPQTGEGPGVRVVAEFDARFQGHVDYALPGPGGIIEVKSTNWDSFCQVKERGAKIEHLAQLQMYLRHGGWPVAYLVYIARDVPHREFAGFPIWTFEVRPDPALADRLDDRARAILAAIDANEPPECECGWCRR